MAENLQRWFAGIDVNASYSEAIMRLADGSRLEFRHTVAERWAKALGPDGAEHQAGSVLAGIARFRLNAKHLDVQFTDGSRFDLRFDQRPTGTEPSK